MEKKTALVDNDRGRLLLANLLQQRLGLLGVEMGSHHAAVAVTDLRGQVRSFRREPYASGHIVSRCIALIEYRPPDDIKGLAKLVANYCRQREVPATMTSSSAAPSFAAWSLRR